MMVRSTGARRALSTALLASIMVFAGVAAGQERDPAAAQALFDQARELMQKGKFAEACPKLQESNRLDPGIGTQFHLADCYERSGRIASAWAAFLEVASQARASNQPERDKAATKRAERLGPRLPRLLVNVPEASKTPGLEIRRNGMVVGAAQWDALVAVDPGEVELTATAPGKQALRQTLRLEEGKTASYSLPVLAPGETVASPPVAGTGAPVARKVASEPAGPAGNLESPPPSNQPSVKNGNAPWIITLAGIGVVGIGLGTAYAVMATSKDDESKGQCLPSDPNACSNAGLELRNDARTKGDIATVSFIVGGAALAGAGIVWLVGGTSSEKGAALPRRLRAAPAIGPNLAALFVRGNF